jgi:hypothetical protein
MFLTYLTSWLLSTVFFKKKPIDVLGKLVDIGPVEPRGVETVGLNQPHLEDRAIEVEKADGALDL